MIDKAVVIDGLGAIRRFFEIGNPSQTIIFDSYQNIIDGAIKLIHNQEQGYAKIKEPDCRICGQSHCKYYHESRKPECKSYIRMEGR